MKNVLLVAAVLSIFWLPSRTEAQVVNPNALAWSTCGSCPEPAEVSASGAVVTVGVAGKPENSLQNNSRHVAAALLPAASGYSIKFRYNLATWDSYNAAGTPNPPFNGGTGFWDGFSVSVSSTPYWQRSLTDPLTPAQLSGLGFLWGGTSFGDLSLETNVGEKIITVAGNPSGQNYLNIGLDTATLPQSNHAFPSWGTFTILEIKPASCNQTSLTVPLYKQCDTQWSSDAYDHISATMCSDGCATSSVAMILSHYGVSTNPGSLNTWLKNRFNDSNRNGQLDPGEATYGYTRTGLIQWAEAAAYSGGSVTFKGSSNRPEDLDTELCSQRPTILQEPGHFIVATGKTPGSYSINDPGFNRTTLESYNNQFTSMRKFGPPGSGAFIIYASEAVQILLSDPLGRRLGFNSGSIVNEIIGGSYLDESIADDDPDDGDTSTSSSHVLFIPSPSEGVYTITVTGITATPGLIDVYRYTHGETPQTLQTLHTNLNPGQVLTQITTYSTRPGDLNSDGLVNNGDLDIVTSSFGGILGGLGYNPVADTNNDGLVNQTDLKLVISNFGVCSPPPIVAPSAVTADAEASSCGVFISDAVLGTAFTSDQCPGIVLTRTGIPQGNFFPVGTTVVTHTATDANGNSSSATQTVTVNDTTAPTITNLSASSTLLWPPSHQLLDVTINYAAADNCCLVSTALSVVSNEPINGLGDGDTGPDWIIVDVHKVRLRAERSGRGNGRNYTIIVTARDCNGNTATRSVMVHVPLSQ